MKLWIVNLRFEDRREKTDVSIILNLPRPVVDPRALAEENLDWIYRYLRRNAGFHVVSVAEFVPEQHGVV